MKFFLCLIQCLLVVLHSASYSRDSETDQNNQKSGSCSSVTQTYQSPYTPYPYNFEESGIFQPPSPDALESIGYQQQAYHTKSTITNNGQNNKTNYGTTKTSPLSTQKAQEASCCYGCCDSDYSTNKKKRNNAYDDDGCFCFICIDTSDQDPCCAGGQHSSADYGCCDGFGDCGGCDFDCGGFD